jgi:hypothetical protein
VRWVCRECGCLYTPGAPCCPACRATAHDEEGAAGAAGQEDEVPKINRFGATTIGSVTTVHASAILPDGGSAPPSVPVPAGEVKPAPEEEAPAVVTVADQKAAGVPPEETVTVAEQKAGTPSPVAAPSAPPAPKAATPPPSPAKPATPQQKATP